MKSSLLYSAVSICQSRMGYLFCREMREPKCLFFVLLIWCLGTVHGKSFCYVASFTSHFTKCLFNLLAILIKITKWTLCSHVVYGLLQMDSMVVSLTFHTLLSGWHLYCHSITCDHYMVKAFHW